MAHYPEKQGLHILSSHNKMRTLQLPRKSRTTSTHDRDAGMGLLSLDLSLTHFAFTLTCMACPPLAPCAFRLPVWMYCYFFQLSGSQFFWGGPKQHLAVVVLKFFDHHDYEFHPKRKNIRGALHLFLFGHLKTIIDTAMKLPHRIPQCIPLQVEPRLLLAKSTFSIYLPFFFKQDNSSVFLVMFSSF